MRNFRTLIQVHIFIAVWESEKITFLEHCSKNFENLLWFHKKARSDLYGEGATGSFYQPIYELTLTPPPPPPPLAHDMNGACKVDHTTGDFHYSVWTVVFFLLHPLWFWLMKEGWKRQGQLLNVTALWHDRFNWDKISIHKPAQSHHFFLALVWTHDLPLGRPMPSQLR